EVVGEQPRLHRQVRPEHAEGEDVGEATGPREDGGISAQGAREREHRAGARGEQGEQHQGSAEKSDHRVSAAASALRISASTSTSSPSVGARYSFPCETISRSLWKWPSRVIVPSTITPMPSRNICGGTPSERTGTRSLPSVTSKARWVVFGS